MFAVSCSDECKLFLSSDDQESKKEEIINHPSDGARDVSSEYVQLKAGRSYYIESQSIQNEWVSPIRVGVRLPNGTVVVPISKEFLRPQKAGLYDEIFFNVSSASVKDFIHDASFPDMPTKGKALSDFVMIDYNKKSIIGHHISGYFMAPETGKFNFFGSCTESCKLFLSSDETCNRRSMVLDYKPTKENPKFDVSPSVELEAGYHYFIDALQVAKSDEVNSLKIGVVMPSGKTSFPIKKNYLQQFRPSEHGVIREVWAGVKGQDIRDLTSMTSYPNTPSSVNILDSFDAPYNERYNYGQRIRGQFVAPMTGDYRFVMSCDKQCELWLSNSEHQERKSRILRQTHATARHQFEKYPNEQVSSPIQLGIGQQYFIEALHKASTGLDHLSVGVTLPNGVNQWPIPLKFLRVKPKTNTESHLKDPPCMFKIEQDEPLSGSTSQITNKTADKDNLGIEPLKNHQPSHLIHGWDDLHKSYSAGEVGRIKGSSENSELELDLGPEASHKMLHDLKSKGDDTQSMIGPTIDLDDEMSEQSNTANMPSNTAAHTQKENKTGNDLISMLTAAKGINVEMGSILDKPKTDGKDDKSYGNVGMENILDKFDGHGKIKIIRLKTNEDLSDEDILNSLKEMGQTHSEKIEDTPLQHSRPKQMQDPVSDSIATLGSFSNGQDYESQQLAKIPPEDAQRLIAELNKPKSPPKIENSDGIKVAGDTGGNLQIMEQNPFSNQIYGSHDIDGVHPQIDTSLDQAAHHVPGKTQKYPLINSLISEGQPVTVVGNIALMDNENSRINSALQSNTNNDENIAVGHPVVPEDHHAQVAEDIHVTHHVPINHVSDYDILALDLAGLKQYSKTGLAMDSMSAAAPTGMGMTEGNYPQQITDEMEEAPLVGDTSMFTDNDGGVSEFYKRGRMNGKTRTKQQKPRKINSKITKIKTAKSTSRSNLSKRTVIGSREQKKGFHIRSRGSSKPIKMKQKQSLGAHKKKHFQPSRIQKIPTNERNGVFHLPKRHWKTKIENGVSRSKVQEDPKHDKHTNVDVVQSLLQPETDNNNEANSLVVSELIENIANEVDGDASPLDEYIDGLKQHLTKNANIVPQKNNIEDILRKKVDILRKRDYLPKPLDKYSLVLDDSDLD